MKVEIYADGACSGNPGPGGWGAVLKYGENEKEISGGEFQTTNNRMELTAVIQALRTLNRKCEIEITTDSKYVVEGMKAWLPSWKANGWRTSAKKPVKNDDLWKELDQLSQQHEITWTWVKGHNGHEYNERADKLATGGIQHPQ